MPPKAGAGPATTSASPPDHAPATTSTTLDPSIPAIQLDAMDPHLVLAAEAEVGSARQGLDRALATQAAAHAAAEAAVTRFAAATQQLQRLDQRQRDAVAAVQAAHDRLRDFAVAEYVSGGPGTPVDTLLAAQTIGDFARRKAIYATVAARRADALRAYTGARNAAEKATLRQIDAVDSLRATAGDLQGRLPAVDVAVLAAAAVLKDREALLTLVTDAASSPGTDIPNMVLDAYRRAASTVQGAGCGLAWWVLAGVGKVESDHGRMEHAHLTASGDLLPHIRGIPLDGRQDTQRVTGAGGAVVEAEGPMQFIPSTWGLVGQDGNGDGKADVDNVYDATLGAAIYLCRSSGDLATDGGLTAAYLSYNHSDAYAVEVLAYARAYQAADAAGRLPAAPPAPLYTLAPPTTTTTTSPPPGH